MSVPTTTNFATCAHCGSSLAIRRTDTAHYTEVIERLEEQTERMDQELRDLRFEHQLLKLDQEWEEERREYMSSGKDGQLHKPSIWNVLIILLVTIGTPISVCFASTFDGSFSLFHLFLLIVIVAGLVMAAREFSMYKQYEEALARYQARRDALLSSRNHDQIAS